jgi:acetaldehyde dehydrogenase/alcohol dehydrogenase
LRAAWDIRQWCFSRNEEVIRKFGESINAGRIILNSPRSIGAMGCVYNDMVPPTSSFGYGTGGGNSTTDNVNGYHYLDIERVAGRTQAHIWSRIPNRIYFNWNAVENPAQFPSRSAVIVASPVLEQIGHVETVRQHIRSGTPVHVLVIPDAEPEMGVILNGLESCVSNHADRIIALGGGSVIDAAKLMRLTYESTDANLEDLGVPFLDIRRRIAKYPDPPAKRPRLIAVSTTSGTGSEVTPDVAIVDPSLSCRCRKCSPRIPASTA